MTQITPEIAKFLRHVRLSFVATVSHDSGPNISPKGTLVALDAKHLAFADIRSPDTVANIAADPRIEISAIDPVLRRGYLFSGTAEVFESGDRFDEACSIYSEMGIKSPIRAVIVVKTESVSEVTSPLYDLGATEAQMRKSWSHRYTDI